MHVNENIQYLSLHQKGGGFRLHVFHWGERVAALLSSLRCWLMGRLNHSVSDLPPAGRTRRWNLTDCSWCGVIRCFLMLRERGTLAGGFFLCELQRDEMMMMMYSQSLLGRRLIWNTHEHNPERSKYSSFAADSDIRSVFQLLGWICINHSQSFFLK